ncbi:hypothetical protein L484_016928 [Morus notabilis]|uniref:t-SNARE coiled-coil homology domain-containing protein n=1 Tax=Morus notabilis TaxID=981085 RepID=W9SK42_9ROSA|nr:hypothetical protein L484_016928 [Morus notabilis]
MNRFWYSSSSCFRNERLVLQVPERGCLAGPPRDRDVLRLLGGGCHRRSQPRQVLRRCGVLQGRAQGNGDECLNASHQQSKTLHNAKAIKDLRSRMDADVSLALKKAKLIKVRLEALDRCNAANQNFHGCGPGSSSDRTRTSVVNGLMKKLKDSMESFNSLHQLISSEYRDTIQRRYFTVTGENPDEKTIDLLISTGESETFLQRAIQEQGRARVLDTIKEIQERQDAVKEMEKNLKELHHVFLDMMVLVQAQGEELDNIESQVARASSVVRSGAKRLQGARAYQNNTRKGTCYVTILLLIVVLVVILSLQLWKWQFGTLLNISLLSLFYNYSCNRKESGFTIKVVRSARGAGLEAHLVARRWKSALTPTPSCASHTGSSHSFAPLPPHRASFASLLAGSSAPSTRTSSSSFPVPCLLLLRSSPSRLPLRHQPEPALLLLSRCRASSFFFAPLLHGFLCSINQNQLWPHDRTLHSKPTTNPSSEILTYLLSAKVGTILLTEVNLYCCVL